MTAYRPGLYKSCRTCFMFYCKFYFTCDRSFTEIHVRYNQSIQAIMCRWHYESMEYLLTNFMTMTPWSVAAATSTLSTPVPARPTSFSRPAAPAAITSAVTLVAERTIKASYFYIVAIRQQVHTHTRSRFQP